MTEGEGQNAAKEMDGCRGSEEEAPTPPEDPPRLMSPAERAAERARKREAAQQRAVERALERARKRGKFTKAPKEAESSVASPEPMPPGHCPVCSAELTRAAVEDAQGVTCERCGYRVHS